MARNTELSGFQKFLIAVTRFFRNIIDRIKKADRRLVIMVAAAVVLLIIIICLIIVGVKANTNSNSEVSSSLSEDSSYVEPGSDTNIINSSSSSSSSNSSGIVGTYVVNTGSDEANLNMRIAAGSSNEKLTEISNGTELEVLYVDDNEDTLVDGEGWGYIEYDGQRGWVAMSCLEEKD